MRLSTVFELLLIFLLIAFAAYGRVIDRDEVTSLRRVVRATEGRAKQGNLGVSILSLNQATENLNKYCTCDRDVCQCCRDFHIPVVSLKGPGCASIRYFEKDNLELQLSFGDNLLTNTVVNGKKPRTICVPMPGGYSKFCGRIYSVERESDDNFKACLGLELQSSYEVEASLRLSCFSFGPDGLKLRPAEAFPPTVLNENDEDDDDDDDDDDLGSFFDFSDDSDNKKDINQLPSKNTAVAGSNQQSDDEDEDDDDDDDDDDDYSLGIDAFLDIITDDDETEKKKPTTATPLLLTVPTINKPTTAKPIVSRTTTKAPKLEAETSTVAVSPETLGLNSETESSTEISLKNATEPSAEEEPTTESSATELALEISSSTSETTDENKTEQPLEAAGSNDNKQVVKVKKVPVIKKIIVGVTDKKTSISSNSANAIKNDVKKPLVKPAKPDPLPKPNNNVDNDDEEDDDLLSAAVDDDEDDGDDDDDDDDEEEEEETENVEDHEENDDVKHEETTSVEGNDKRPDHDNDHEEVSEEDLLDDDDDDDDDDEEEETSLMSALIDDDNDDNKKNKNGSTSTEASKKDNEYENIDDFFRKKNACETGQTE